MGLWGVMITKTKLRISRGQTYLCNHSGEKKELRVTKVIKREDNGSLVKHQYGWDELDKFVKRDPVYLGQTRKFLGVPLGYKSKHNVKEQPPALTSGKTENNL